MSMLTVRLQVLVSPAQKRRLEAEAHSRGESIGELVREAIDARYGRMPSRRERMAAVERLRRAPLAARSLTPEQIDRAQEQEIEDEYPKLSTDRSIT